MKLLPFDNLTLYSPYSPEAAISRLQAVVEPRRSFALFTTRQMPYEGWIKVSEFEITHIIRYRNSFLPVIKGNIQTIIGGTNINIQMKPNVFVLLFMAVWLGGTGIGFFSTLIPYLTGDQQADLGAVLFTGGMFFLGYLLIMFGYKSEARKSKRFFLELFQAREIQNLE